VRIVLSAVGSVAIATGVGWIIPHERPGVPAALYLTAVLTSSLLAGVWAGVLASVLGLLALDALFIPPLYSIGFRSADDISLGVVFLVAAAIGAGLVVRLRAAWANAERDGRRAAAVAQVTRALAASRSMNEIGDAVVHVGGPSLGAKAAGVFLFEPEPEPGELRLLASSGYGAFERSWAKFSVEEPVPAADVVRTRQPVLLGSIEERATRYGRPRAALRMGPGALAALPLVLEDTVLGAVTLSFPDDHRFDADDTEFLRVFALQCAQAIERTRLESEERALRERSEFLAAAGEALGSSLDLDRTFEQVADLAVPRCADWAVLDILEEDGSIRLAAVAHRDPEMVRWARDLRGRRPPTLRDETGVGAVIRTGEPQMYPDLSPEVLEAEAEDDTQREIIRRLAPRSVILAPVAAREQVLGVITLIRSETDQRYTPADLDLATDLAGRIGRAIENARLYMSERAARKEAERASHRLRLISRTVELLSELEYPAVFERLAAVVVEELADLCLVDVLEPSGALQRVAAVHADPAKQPLADRLRAEYAPRREGPHPVAKVIERGVVEFAPRMTEDFLRATTQDADHFRIVKDLGFQSYMCAPLVARGRILGTITFVSCDPNRRYEEVDAELALDVARPAAVRIENARLFFERDLIARSMQEILLPESLPEIEGFELAAMYRPGREGMEVGGDFYDVFIRPDGSFGMVIGDVCGHGPEAAAVMGLARQTVRVAGMNDARPSGILRVVNEVLIRGAYDRFVTACDVRVLPRQSGGRLVICSAGHPLPWIVRADGRVESAGRWGTLLGIMDDVQLTDDRVELERGDALVLYTDGLVEWPSRADVESSLTALLSSLVGCSASRITSAIETWWIQGTGGRAQDDAAVLVLRAVR
jgi:GAF domain-containing protein